MYSKFSAHFLRVMFTNLVVYYSHSFINCYKHIYQPWENFEVPLPNVNPSTDQVDVSRYLSNSIFLRGRWTLADNNSPNRLVDFVDIWKRSLLSMTESHMVQLCLYANMSSYYFLYIENMRILGLINNVLTKIWGLVISISFF